MEPPSGNVIPSHNRGSLTQVIAIENPQMVSVKEEKKKEGESSRKRRDRQACIM